MFLACLWLYTRLSPATPPHPIDSPHCRLQHKAKISRITPSKSTEIGNNGRPKTSSTKTFQGCHRRPEQPQVNGLMWICSPSWSLPSWASTFAASARKAVAEDPKPTTARVSWSIVPVYYQLHPFLRSCPWLKSIVSRTDPKAKSRLWLAQNADLSRCTTGCLHLGAPRNVLPV